MKNDKLLLRSRDAGQPLIVGTVHSAACLKALAKRPQEVFQKIDLLEARLDSLPSARLPLARIFSTNRDEKIAKSDGARENTQTPFVTVTPSAMSTYSSSQNGRLTRRLSGFLASALDQNKRSGLVAPSCHCYSTSPGRGREWKSESNRAATSAGRGLAMGLGH